MNKAKIPLLKKIRRSLHKVRVAWSKITSIIDYYIIYPYICKKFNFTVLNSDETINKILEEKPCVSRFGDGEFFLMRNKDIGFQKNDKRLAERLNQIIKSEEDGLLVCITDIMLRNEGYVRATALYNAAFVVHSFDSLMKLIPENHHYGCTNFTRFYIDFKDKSHSIMQHKIDIIRKIWEGYNVYIIEGEYTRSGIGNNLYDNALSVHRIICPATNAYEKYDAIFKTTCELIPLSKDAVILCLLGPTATVLAYDLYKQGYWAIDMGHVDIEYEWFIRGTSWKVNIPGKAVNECGNNHPDNSISLLEYDKQIIAKIL